jgi:uncharacterized protein (DUF427 family)
MRPQPLPPGPGQESVWDYPRPPRLEPTSRHILIVANGVTLADTHAAFRVLETSHPPVYYLPPADIAMKCLHPAPQSSWCEWKGQAQYFDIVVNGVKLPQAAWSYPQPAAPFRAIAGYVAFYAGPMDGCFVDGERVSAQPGGFYGGWITSDIVGPFKGEPGSWGW